jgi:anaerobic magnesium-protoporphyrin IX monomethyl ester cyclase
MKLSIIVPRWVARANDYYAFPLGLAYISAVLKRDGHTVSVLNCNHFSEPVELLIKNFILQNNPQVVCTGGLSIHFSLLRQIISNVKSISSEIKTVLGGGIISSDPQLIFESIKPDFGVIGEGEITISELIKAIEANISFKDTAGLIYKDASGEIITTAQRTAITDLDNLPWPDYEGFDIDKQLEAMLPTDENYLHMHDNPRMLPMISSRSCPFSCSFCFHPLGNQYRERSLDDFFKELNHLVTHYSLNSVMVLDELFAVKKERLYEFCTRIKPYNITWIVQLRVDTVDKETLSVMKEAGCVFISYGIESMSDSVLESMRKKTNHKAVETALELTASAGIGIQGNLLFGDKAENSKTMEESLLWWADNRRYQINLTPIYAYPGTELYNFALEKGLIKDKINFLERNCPPLNVTQIDDNLFSEMIHMVETLHETVNTDTLTSVENVKLMPQKSPLRGDLLVEFDTTCQHCQSKMTYKNIPIGKNPMARFTLRMACKICNSRNDMAMSLRLESPQSEEINTLLNQAEKFASNGQFPDALQCLSSILKKVPVNDQATAFTGKIMLQLRKIDEAVYWLSLAVRVNPLVASTQASLATALAAKRNYLGATFHMKEAWKLSKIEDDSQQKQKLRIFKLFIN